MSEAAALAKSNSQKLPENISVEELFNFNMRAEFETLRDGAPMLYHVICGAMGVEKKDLKVICNAKNISYFLLFLTESYPSPSRRHLCRGHSLPGHYPSNESVPRNLPSSEAFSTCARQRRPRSAQAPQREDLQAPEWVWSICEQAVS